MKYARIDENGNIMSKVRYASFGEEHEREVRLRSFKRAEAQKICDNHGIPNSFFMMVRKFTSRKDETIEDGVKKLKKHGISDKTITAFRNEIKDTIESRRMKMNRKDAIKHLSLHLPNRPPVLRTQQQKDDWWDMTRNEIWFRNCKDYQNHDDADLQTDKDMIRWQDSLNDEFLELCSPSKGY